VHHWIPEIQSDAFGLLKSVIPDASTIQMPTVQVRVWAENAGVGISQWTEETMGILQNKDGLTTQQIDNKVREQVWEIAKSRSIINKQSISA